MRKFMAAVLALLALLPAVSGRPILDYSQGRPVFTEKVEVSTAFSGTVTLPSTISDDVAEALENSKVSLYAFTAQIPMDSGGYASMTLYVLQISLGDFEGFNLTVNGQQIMGRTYVPYAEKLPVYVETPYGTFSAFLQPHPQVTSSGLVDVPANFTEGRLLSVENLTLVGRRQGKDLWLEVVSGNKTISEGIIEAG